MLPVKATKTQHGDKSGLLALTSTACAVLVLSVTVRAWLHAVNLANVMLSALCWVNAAIWLLVLWWATHHLTHQIASLFQNVSEPPQGKANTNARFLLLYATCDDFDEAACTSCAEQDYSRDRHEVIICDDSARQKQQDAIDSFARRHTHVRVVRRSSRDGFKAGNLNHAIRQARVKANDYDDAWIVVVDADQTLPPTFLSDVAAAIADQPAEVAFVQAAHESEAAAPHAPDSTPFQGALGMEIKVFYQRDLPPRKRYGFVPFLGHGAAVRLGVWEQLKGFPPLVSEDYAFAMRALAKGWRGAYVEHAHSWEAFPKDFGSFVTRLRKFAGGSAELFRLEAPGFLLSPASFIEKYDWTMLLLWYPLAPLTFANGFLSAYVCHALWTHRIPYLHPLLPYLFVAMFLMAAPILMSTTRRPFAAVRYWFSSLAVYSACLPLVAGEFCLHLWTRPTFTRTPKGSEPHQSLRGTSSIMVLLGVLALMLSVRWWSPFSPLLAAHGLAYLLFPAWLWFADASWRGRVSRALAWLPGMLVIAALYAMWRWGKF